MADSTLRLVVDIEPRFAQEAFALFGRAGTPMVVAALKTAAQQEKPEPKGGVLAQLAARMCKEPGFVAFIRPIYDRAMGGDGSGWGDVALRDFDGEEERYARHCIMVLCDLKESRRELDHNPEAARKFRELIFKPWSRRTQLEPTP